MHTVRRTAALAALLALALFATAVAAAGPPRLERKRLRPADMALARQIALRGSDLASGWARGRPTTVPDQLPRCPGVDMDFSRFTITGRAQSKFTQDVAGIESLVGVFESRSDAVEDFRKGSDPRLIRCAAAELKKRGLTVHSFRMTGRPPVGERAISYRIVVSAAGTRVYMDVVGFQSGRSVVGLYFTDTHPIAGRLAVARSVAARMR